MAERYRKRLHRYNDVRTEECSPIPFYLPDWEKNTKSKTQKQQSRTHFPLDPRKHPVSILYEYCSMQSLQPSFQFYEIPQKCGLEYGCIAMVEDFQGKGRSFSKKISKHLAAENLLKKLLQPDYLGEKELGPKRFVSETGIVVVHYDETPVKRSCFRNRRRMTTPTYLRKTKKVKWQDSDGETEDESHKSFEEHSVECSDNQMELTQDNEPGGGHNINKSKEENSDCQVDDKVETEDEEKKLESEGRFKSSSVETKVIASTIQTSSRKEENQDLMKDISEYLSDRLLSTSIDEVKEDPVIQENYSSDEIKVVELNDVKLNKRKKKKRSYSEMMDGTFILSRKSCLKEVNPIGYLQEACVHFDSDAPSYNFYRGGGHVGIKSVCSLFDITTEGLGQTLKEAKRMSAITMIRQLGW